MPAAANLQPLNHQAELRAYAVAVASSQARKVPHFSYLGNATCCDTEDSQKGGTLLLGVTAKADEAE